MIRTASPLFNLHTFFKLFVPLMSSAQLYASRFGQIIPWNESYTLCLNPTRLSYFFSWNSPHLFFWLGHVEPKHVFHPKSMWTPTFILDSPETKKKNITKKLWCLPTWNKKTLALNKPKGFGPLRSAAKLHQVVHLLSVIALGFGIVRNVTWKSMEVGKGMQGMYQKRLIRQNAHGK